jgi:hypothetical protein
LGRYFYDVPATWVDLGQNRQPVTTPVLSAWAVPENWRKGMRPKNGDGKVNAAVQCKGPNTGNSRSRTKALSRPSKDCEGNEQASSTHGPAATSRENELDQRILEMEKAVGTAFYRNILREYGRVNQPKLIRDVAVERKVLQMLESVTRGFIVWKPS